MSRLPSNGSADRQLVKGSLSQTLRAALSANQISLVARCMSIKCHGRDRSQSRNVLPKASSHHASVCIGKENTASSVHMCACACNAAPRWCIHDAVTSRSFHICHVHRECRLEDGGLWSVARSVSTLRLSICALVNKCCDDNECTLRYGLLDVVAPQAHGTAAQQAGRGVSELFGEYWLAGLLHRWGEFVVVHEKNKYSIIENVFHKTKQLPESQKCVENFIVLR